MTCVNSLHATKDIVSVIVLGDGLLCALDSSLISRMGDGGGHSLYPSSASRPPDGLLLLCRFTYSVSHTFPLVTFFRRDSASRKYILLARRFFGCFSAELIALIYIILSYSYKLFIISSLAKCARQYYTCVYYFV